MNKKHTIKFIDTGLRYRENINDRFDPPTEVSSTSVLQSDNYYTPNRLGVS